MTRPSACLRAAFVLLCILMVYGVSAEADSIFQTVEPSEARAESPLFRFDEEDFLDAASRAASGRLMEGLSIPWSVPTSIFRSSPTRMRHCITSVDPRRGEIRGSTSDVAVH